MSSRVFDLGWAFMTREAVNCVRRGAYTTTPHNSIVATPYGDAVYISGTDEYPMVVPDERTVEFLEWLSAGAVVVTVEDSLGVVDVNCDNLVYASTRGYVVELLFRDGSKRELVFARWYSGEPADMAPTIKLKTDAAVGALRAGVERTENKTDA